MTMKVVELQEFGGVEYFSLKERPLPEPQEGEVRVKIKAASVNPVDYKTRKGLLGGEVPMVLGVDLAGVVDKTGPEVDDLQPGDSVFGFVDAQGPASNGSYAEYVSLPRSFLALKPEGLSFAEAASLAMVGLTAYQCVVDKASLAPGEAVFVAGGAGAVGSVALQLARHKGAGPLLTTAGSETSMEYLVGELGLEREHILNYRGRSLEEMKEALLVMNGGRPVAAAFDFVGGIMKRLCCEVIDFDGRVTTIVEEEDDFRLHAVSGEKSPLLQRSATLHTQLLLARSRFGTGEYWEIFARELELLAELVKKDQLKGHRIVMLDAFTAEAVADAHSRLEGGHVDGKLVLPIGG